MKKTSGLLVFASVVASMIWAGVALAASSGSIYVINTSVWSDKIHVGDIVGVQMHSYAPGTYDWTISKKIKGGQVLVAGAGIDAPYSIAVYPNNSGAIPSVTYEALTYGTSWVKNYSLIAVPVDWQGSTFTINVGGKNTNFQVLGPR